MELIKDNIYHIYNQGNNRQKIFYNRDNYLFFLQKMNDYLLPYCDVLAWCLMPNHFHRMVYVRETELEIPTSRGAITGKTEVDRVTSNRESSRGAIAGRTEIDRVTRSHPVNGSITKRNLNDSIAILLRSYTRAINVEQSRSGSLFRQKTKADCITNPQEVSPSYYNLGFGTLIYIPDPDKDYPQICFNYIHQNPVKVGLVKNLRIGSFRRSAI
jgi:putative transposase